MPALKPGHISPTPEEAAMIQAGIEADPENFEWTAENFARARPAREMLPEIFGPEVAAKMLKPRGRPRLAAPKEKINVRLSPDVLAALRNTGRGWQTRIDTLLREAVAAGRI